MSDENVTKCGQRDAGPGKLDSHAVAAVYDISANRQLIDVIAKPALLTLGMLARFVIPA